jgi:hypothetical protein
LLQEHSMRIAMIGASLFMLAIGGTQAEAAAWCAYYDRSTSNCGFRTFQQCLATISGQSGAWCAQNPQGGYEDSRRRSRQQY